MNVLPQLVALVGPLSLLILTAIAGYSYAVSRSLSLPIPQILALFTVVLPLIALVSTQTVHRLVRSSRQGQNRITFSLLAVIGFQLIYETIIATLATTYIVPPSALDCGLGTRWRSLHSAKNADAIRAIQDALKCCGFRSTSDMAFPFGNPSRCAEVFGRSQSCYGPWRQKEQINAGLLLLVAISVFTVKVLSLISAFTDSPWAHPRWTRPLHRHTIESEEHEEDSRTTPTRLIEEGNGTAEQYHDEPSGAPPPRTLEASLSESQSREEGPRVVPSSLIDTDNAWRDQEEEHAA